MFKLIDEPLKGSLLVAEPFLGDPNFERTVVLLTEHGQMGTVGFVMNKPLEINLEQALPEFEGVQMPVYYGGPVSEENLYYLHRYGNLIPNSHHVVEDLYWGGDFHALRELYQSGVVDLANLKFFLGYSGWEKDQLLGELSSHSWMVLSFNQENLLSADAEALWKDVLLNLGGHYTLWANAPADPTMN